jgi:hypothetical protein
MSRLLVCTRFCLCILLCLCCTACGGLLRSGLPIFLLSQHPCSALVMCCAEPAWHLLPWLQRFLYQRICKLRSRPSERS